MSWSSGAKVFFDIAGSVSEIVSDENERQKLYIAMIDHFENHDCDNICDIYKTNIDDLNEVLENYYGFEKMDFLDELRISGGYRDKEIFDDEVAELDFSR
jgi:hypothetical protein